MRLEQQDLELCVGMFKAALREVLSELGIAPQAGASPRQQPPPPTIYSEQEAADLLRLSKKQLADERRRGRIEGIRGRRRTYRYELSAIEKYIAQQKRKSA